MAQQGPWIFTPCEHNVGHISSGPNEFGDIATAWDCGGDPKANAKLMAASPELLDATKRLLAIIKDALQDDNLDADTDSGAILCGDVCADAVFAAQAAIAKAGASQALTEAAA